MLVGGDEVRRLLRHGLELCRVQRDDQVRPARGRAGGASGVGRGGARTLSAAAGKARAASANAGKGGAARGACCGARRRLSLIMVSSTSFVSSVTLVWGNPTPASLGSPSAVTVRSTSGLVLCFLVYLPARSSWRGRGGRSTRRAGARCGSANERRSRRRPPPATRRPGRRGSTTLRTRLGERERALAEQGGHVRERVELRRDASAA